jgi:hypothetical protein
MRQAFIAVFCLGWIGVAGSAQAADKPNPTGNWTIAIEVLGESHTYLLKLKVDGEKLTGSVVDDKNNEVGRGKEYPLRAGKYKDGALSFTVIGDGHGAQMPIVATGRFSGDTMKGKANAELDGQALNIVWEAQRIVAGNPTGTWNMSVEVNGKKQEFTLKLKLDGDKLTGAMVGKNGKESVLQNAKYKDGDMSFTIVRDEVGKKMPITVTAIAVGETMSGMADFTLDGQEQNISWEAKRATK